VKVDADQSVNVLRLTLDKDLMDIEVEARITLGKICGPRNRPFAVSADRHQRKQDVWPRPASPNDQVRGVLALLTLRNVATMRGSLGKMSNEAVAVAALALSLGLLSRDYLWKTHLSERSHRRARRGGSVRGQKIAMKATGIDAAIRQSFNRWNLSDNLREQYRSAAMYHKKRTKTRLSLKTIRRHLQRLGLSSEQGH
jgi:hypothetical protein